MSSNFDLIGKVLDFKVECMVPENVGPALGKIEFLKADDHTVYVSWNVYTAGGKSIGGRSDNLFSKPEDRNNETVVAQVVRQIEKFRIGRQNVFKEFELLK